MLTDEVQQILFGNRTHQTVNDHAILEQQHSRNALDTIAHGQIRRLVQVHLASQSPH